ncbi:MAG: DUF3052 family protein [Betaproteobacteria bacterium]|nr:DUF3052 family protein [Betaproteobacteria bacterium]
MSRGPQQKSDRPRIDKLGVKEGLRVAVIGVDDDSLLSELRARTDEIVIGMPRSRRDVIFYAAESLNALGELETLRTRIVHTGAIWVVSRKGRDRSISDTDVITAAKRVGLVDNKVVSFSETHTALRLVIPLALRDR